MTSAVGGVVLDIESDPGTALATLGVASRCHTGKHAVASTRDRTGATTRRPGRSCSPAPRSSRTATWWSSRTTCRRLLRRPHVRPGAQFLDDLSRNNSKPWFEAHRDRYERDLREPAVAFVEAMAPRLARLSPHLRAVAKGTGSSISRIHRDTRFSADKSPYKDWLGMHFVHESGKEAPGLHLHVSRADCGVGLGVWMLDPPSLAKVRDRIAAADGGWGKARAALDRGGFRFIGDSLKKVPKGYPPEHPHAEDLKRKTFGAGRPVDPKLPLPALCDQVESSWRAGWPLMTFLCAALDLDL